MVALPETSRYEDEEFLKGTMKVLGLRAALYAARSPRTFMVPLGDGFMGKLNERESVVVVTTGGTIEKSYCEEEGTLQNRESIVKRVVFDNLRLPYTYVSYHSIIGKDSLEMTDSDRELINMFLQNMLKNDSPIVVIHGTDTMSETVKFCYNKLMDDGLTVPIIFTGAMKPVEFLDSDAVQNLTEAVMASKILAPGIYISFHGRIFEAPNVRKNYQKGTFEAY